MRPHRLWHVLLILLALFCAVGFQKSSSSTVPTFYRDIVPILQQHCQTCHRSGEIAPIPLVNYSDAQKYAAKMKAMTEVRRMPPWFADSQIGKWMNDPSLSDAQIATIAEWADAGAPAGDPQ